MATTTGPLREPRAVNEVTMQKLPEILTPPKVPPSSLHQVSKWLEEMQHGQNLCIKTRQNVHPQTLVAFVVKTMIMGVIQHYRTIGDTWDALYSKHQLRDSDITLDRVYSMLSEFLIELKLRISHRAQAERRAGEDHSDRHRQQWHFS